MLDHNSELQVIFGLLAVANVMTISFMDMLFGSSVATAGPKLLLSAVASLQKVNKKKLHQRQCPYVKEWFYIICSSFCFMFSDEVCPIHFNDET